MTNPTPTENERIALLRDWERWPHPGGEVWIRRDSDISLMECPDYLHEWEHAGPLLEELPDDVRIEITLNTIPNIEGKGKFRCCLTRNLSVLGVGTGDTRKAAASRAWLAWQEEK